MKLAEALLLRSDLQKKSDNLKQRILRNLKIQEGGKTFEDPNSLISEYNETEDELCELIKRINDANHDTKLESGESLSHALAKRDSLLKKQNALSDILQNATDHMDFRMTHMELKIYTTVNIEGLQKQRDEIAKKIRLVDAEIQAKNWTVDM